MLETYSVFRWELVARLLPLLAGFSACAILAGLSAQFLTKRVRRIYRWGWRLGEAGTSEMEFALAFPWFLMMVLLTIQMTLLINATLVVDYAAFCAARSAAVWLPQDLPGEPTNAVAADRYRPGKWDRIRQAARLACVPASPRLTSFVSQFIGLPSGPTQTERRAIEEMAQNIGTGGAVDPVRFTLSLIDKYAASYLLTDVDLVNGAGQPVRSFEGGRPVTAKVTHKFYMNVPVGGALLGAVLGYRFVPFFGPYYVPLTASYSLMVAPS